MLRRGSSINVLMHAIVEVNVGKKMHYHQSIFHASMLKKTFFLTTFSIIIT